MWLYGPGSMTWEINRHSVMLLGGRAALLMQLAHPSVAAGVAQHSNFRDDPFGRLRRTLDVMLTIVFGDVETAKRTIEGVDAIHRKVIGTRGDGMSYFARDPKLLMWVYSTLVDSSVKVYRACVGSLSDDDADAYYREGVTVARMFGIPDDVMPVGYLELKDWIRSMVDSGEVVVTDLAREMAAPILSPIRVIPDRVSRASAIVTAGLLPRPIREGYGLKLSGSRRALLAAGRVASRMALPLLPGPLRTFPLARKVPA